MAEWSLPGGVPQPDVYIAAIGRSGSTMLCNWLSRPPDQLMFVEPFFTRSENPRLLRIQLEDFGMPASEGEWSAVAAALEQRFGKLMGPRLAGRRWGFKEVLADEHQRVLAAFRPRRVLFSVRDIADVALSFFEKHRLQDNLERFSDDWVADYCMRETAGLLSFGELVTGREIPSRVVRYEDFTRSIAEQAAVAEFVGWEAGGRTDAHLERFDRGFETERHGARVSSDSRLPNDRPLDDGLRQRAAAIAAACADYQHAFGYA